MRLGINPHIEVGQGKPVEGNGYQELAKEFQTPRLTLLRQCWVGTHSYGLRLKLDQLLVVTPTSSETPFSLSVLQADSHVCGSYVLLFCGFVRVRVPTMGSYPWQARTKLEIHYFRDHGNYCITTVRINSTYKKANSSEKMYKSLKHEWIVDQTDWQSFNKRYLLI